MKNKKKAFTLVELLAVIVILAIILVIAIPQIIKTIKASKLKAMESSAKLIAKNAEDDYLAQQTLNEYYDATSIPCADVAKLGSDYESCEIVYEDGVATVTLVGAVGGKFDGITCTGTKDNMVCEIEEPISYTYITYVIDDNTQKRIGYYERNGEIKSNVPYERPSKEGYIFLGWYKETTYTNKFELDNNNMPTSVEELTVYAKWIDMSLLYTYTSNDDGTTITGLTDYGLELYYNDELTTLEFPSTLNNKNVIAITPVTTNYKFNGKSKIQEIIIPDTVRSISSSAFTGIPNLAKITMPIDISAGGNIFNTAKLEELHLTKGSTGIGYNYNCGSSSDSTLCEKRSTAWYTSRTYGGASETSVGEKPLLVTIGEGVKSIGSNTFNNAYRIKLVGSMPNSLETIANSSFETAGLDQSLIFNNNIKNIGSRAFINTLIKNIDFGKGSLIIGESAFQNSGMVDVLEIPDTIERIENLAFANLKITELKIKGDKTTYNGNVFKNIKTLNKLEIPITLSGGLVYGATQLEELHLTKGSTGIGYNYNCGSSSDSTLCEKRSTAWYTSRTYGGASETSVGEKPLLVTIGEGVKSIGSNTFNNAYRIQLQSTISGITIGSNAFTNSGAIID